MADPETAVRWADMKGGTDTVIIRITEAESAALSKHFGRSFAIGSQSFTRRGVQSIWNRSRDLMVSVKGEPPNSWRGTTDEWRDHVQATRYESIMLDRLAHRAYEVFRDRGDG